MDSNQPAGPTQPQRPPTDDPPPSHLQAQQHRLGRAEGAGVSSPSPSNSAHSSTAPSPRLTANPPPLTLAGASPGSGLSQLERDVLAKSGGNERSSDGASRPGAVSMVGPGGGTGSAGTRPASSLAQLERDIQSKSQADPSVGSSGAGRYASTKPGVVAVVNKEPVNSSAVTSASLTELERDVLAKTQASRHRGIGASPAATNALSSSSLSRLGRGVLEKSSPSCPSDAPASRPGAVDVVGGGGGDYRDGNTSLTQLERDVFAKSSRGSGHRGPADQRPGAVSVPHNASGTASPLTPVATGLTQLERDLAAKSKSRPSPAAPPPGAVPVAAVPTSPDRVKSAPSSSLPPVSVCPTSPAAGAHGLSELERDILAKSSASSGGGSGTATIPGAVSVRGIVGASTADERVNALSQLERDVLAKGSALSASDGREGAQPTGASASVPGPGLSQLERDVLAKSGGIRTSGDAMRSQSRPGAVAVQAQAAVVGSLKQPPGSTSLREYGAGADLSQLERDSLAKGSVGSVTSCRSEIPGVVSSGTTGSSVSDLERVVLSEGVAPAPRSSGAAALSQLERDVTAKRSVCAPQGSQPGALAGGSRSSALATSAAFTSAERDVMPKGSASGESRASHPGVVVSGSVATTNPDLDAAVTRTAPLVGICSTVTQLEQEVLAKASSAIGRTTPAGSESFTVSQLERDVLTKGSASIGNHATLPGAVASSVAGIQGPQKFSVAACSSLTGERTLSRLERELVTKSAAVAARSEDATSSLGGLSQLEQDVLSKQRSSFDVSFGARALTHTAAAAHGSPSHLENEDIVAKRSSLLTAPLSSGIASLRSLEGDIAAKKGSVHTGRRSDESGALSSIRRLENAVLEKSQATSHPTIGYGELIDIEPPDDSPYLADESVESQHRQDTSIAYGSDSQFELGDSGEAHVAFQPPTFVADYGGNYAGQEQPVGMYSPDALYGFDAGAGGIEAFVADNVVDATGVAVIMSEEEELKMIRKKQNKQFLILGLIVVVLIVVVVVSVVLTVGKADPLPPSAAPSPAPTFSPTMAPTTERLQAVLDSLRVVTGDSENIGVTSSPQYRAALWLADDDSFVRDQKLTPQDTKFLQRYALATMYYSLGGDDWDDCGEQSSSCGSDPSVKPWLSASDECEWKYLKCSDGVLVDEASFFANEQFLTKEVSPLIGTLPTEMALLTDLRYFQINRFPVEGTLERKFNCPNLQTLILTKTNLAGSIPDDFFISNPSLRLVDMSFSWLNGTIPRTLGSLSFLEDLQLNNNNFTGELGEIFTSLTKLTRLTLQENLLTGQVPDSLFALSSLQVLRVDVNPLKGNLPSSMENLQSLRELRVGNSGMGGFLPGDVWTLPSLEILDVGGANFSGTIPETIIGLNDTVRELLLYSNGFSGRIPDNAARLDVLEVFLLYGNDFTGTMPPAICGLRGNEDGALFDLRVTCGTVECSCCNPCEQADGSD